MWAPFPRLMKPVVQCCTEVNRKPEDEGGQAQCDPYHVSLWFPFFLFSFLRLAELTFISLLSAGAYT